MIRFTISFVEWFVLFCSAVAAAYIVGWVVWHICKSVYETWKGE